MMARYYKYPESKERGIQHLPTLVFFASEHVCVKKNASVNPSLILRVITLTRNQQLY